MTKANTKASLLATIAKLESELSRERRQSGAMAEWLYCENNKHATMEHDVEIDGTLVLRVVIHGMCRASGGVCVVYVVNQDWHDLPRYLDDLCQEWLSDPGREIREAARLFMARRALPSGADRALPAHGSLRREAPLRHVCRAMGEA